MNPTASALILGDLQNDFLHPRRRLWPRRPEPARRSRRCRTSLRRWSARARERGILIVATLFTLVPGRGGEPIISPHLKALRPFLKKGDFAPGGWGQQLVDELAPADVAVEKVAYSAFYMTPARMGAAQMRHRAALFHRHRHQWRRRLHRARRPCARIRLHRDRGRLRARSPMTFIALRLLVCDQLRGL